MKLTTKRNTKVIALTIVIGIIVLTLITAVSATVIKEKAISNSFSKIEVYTSGDVSDLKYLQSENVFDVTVKDAHHLTLTIGDSNVLGQIAIYDNANSDHGIVISRTGIMGDLLNKIEVHTFGSESVLRYHQDANAFDIVDEDIDQITLTAGDSNTSGSIVIYDDAYQDIAIEVVKN